ncbi:MAG: hypothetical protein QOF60_56 [Actinomycetota bacterium]|jgi:hypothetical protein|nr:hypothetical protein [Actinomycetota bacterium]
MSCRGRGDDGQIAGVEGVIFGVLVFVLGTLVVANAWGVVDAKMAAAGAAREATRAFVESRSPTTSDALAEARSAASDAIAGYGRTPSRMRFVAEEAALQRCARVTIRVEYPVPLVVIPVIGRYGHGFTARARHSEIVDPFRSGLADTNECPAELRP